MRAAELRRTGAALTRRTGWQGARPTGAASVWLRRASAATEKPAAGSPLPSGGSPFPSGGGGGVPPPLIALGAGAVVVIGGIAAWNLASSKDGVEKAEDIKQKLAAKKEAKLVEKAAKAKAGAEAKAAADEAKSLAEKAKAEAAVVAAAAQKVADDAKAAIEAMMAEAGSGVKEAASGVLATVEQEVESASAKREAARAALAAAIEAGDPEGLGQAIAVAKGAMLGTTGEMQQAEALAAPRRLLLDRSLTSEELAELLLLPQEFRGLTPELAEERELKACEGMSRQELEARVTDLARMLAEGRLHSRTRIEEALLTRLEAAEEVSLGHLTDALQRMAAEHEVTAKTEMEQLEVKLQQELADEVAKAVAAAEAEAQAKLDAEAAEWAAEAATAVLQERATRVHEAVSMSEGLASIEQVLREDEANVRRVHAYNSLTAAVLSLEDSILGGREASAELQALRQAARKADIFLAGILDRLPEGCVKLCSRPGAVPTEPLLRQRIAEHRHELVAAALVPPNSGLFGELVGRLLSRFYILDAGVAGVAGEEASETAANLNALSSPKGGEPLAASLTRMEGSLRGQCRERAADLLQEARDALLLHQALRAVKARAQCLTVASA